MKNVALILRGIISVPIFFGGLVFFAFAGIIFAPVGLMWVISVLWICCFKWIAILMRVKVESLDEIEDLSWGIFILWFACCYYFVEKGHFPE